MQVQSSIVIHPSSLQPQPITGMLGIDLGNLAMPDDIGAPPAYNLDKGNPPLPDRPPNTSTVPILTIPNSFQLYLTPELRPQKRPNNQQVEYHFSNCVIVDDMQTMVARMAQAVVISIPSSNFGTEMMDNVLALHCTFESSYKDTLAIVDFSNGNVVSTLDTPLQPSAASSPAGQSPSKSKGGITSFSKTDAVVLEPPSAQGQPSLVQGKPSTVRQAADILVNASVTISGVLSTKAYDLASYIDRKSTAVQPSGLPPRVIDPATKKNVSTVKSYATAAKSLTTKAVGVALGVAGTVGKQLTSRLNQDGDAYYAISRGVIAWNNISEGLEFGFRVVSETAGHSTVEIVQKKYGDDAAGLAMDITSISGSLVLIYFDARGIGRKAILKAVAKNAVLGK
eukprot:Partr_v1_DN27752_c0_g1_i3_m66963